MIRLIAVLMTAFLLGSPAAAQQPGGGNNDTSFSTPGNAFVQGTVQMCRNGSNQAVPCSSGTPLQVANPTPLAGTAGAGYPPGATAITGNATGTTAAVVGTLAAAAGKFTYICGVSVSSAGGTATIGPITIAGLIGSSQVHQVATNVATGQQELNLNFFPCIQGSAVNTAITTTTTANGTATAVDVNSWGFQE